jgi:hypothetical protein
MQIQLNAASRLLAATKVQPGMKVAEARNPDEYIGTVLDIKVARKEEVAMVDVGGGVRSMYRLPELVEYKGKKTRPAGITFPGLT